MKADSEKTVFRSGAVLIAATALALAVSLCLVGCASGPGSSQSSASASASMSAASSQVKDVPCYFEADAEPRQVSLTFFDDMPSVPYIRIDDFYQTFMHGKMDVVASDGGVFTLTVEDGTKATADAGKDTFAADDFTAFVSQPLLKGDGASALATSLAPYLALEGETVERAASPVEINFARYGIDLRAMDGALYLPLATVNDLFETRAMKYAFHEDIRNIAINSTKSMTGHLLGGAGGIELIVCVKAIEESYVHVTAGSKETEGEMDLDYTFFEPKTKNITYAMTNNLGFGGHNASLIVKKFEE